MECSPSEESFLRPIFSRLDQGFVGPFVNPWAFDSPSVESTARQKTVHRQIEGFWANAEGLLADTTFGVRDN
jgi:hypothetical protein